MNWLTALGVFFVIAGVTEFVLFGRVLKDHPQISRRRTLLLANAGANLVIGAGLLVLAVS